MTRGFSAGIAIAATAYLWIVAASNIYCAGIGRVDLFVFPFTQWLQIAPDWRANWWITLWVVVSAGIPTLAVLALLISFRWFWRSRRRLRRPLGGGLKPLEAGVSDNHGHSQWRSMKDAKALFYGPNPGYGGIAVGEAYRVDQDTVSAIPFDPKNKKTWGKGGKAKLLIDPCVSGSTHNITIAGTGSYKSVCAVTTILKWTGSSVILDPSRELGPMLDAALRAQGKNVAHVGIKSRHDIAACGIDVLAWIDIDHPEAEMHVRSVIGIIYDEDAAQTGTKSNDPFFMPMGKSLVTCLLAHLLWSTDDDLRDTDGTVQPRNLATLAAGIATSEREMPKILKEINEKSKSPMAVRLAASLMEIAAPETFSGIYVNAFKGTEWLTTDAYADLVSSRGFNPKSLLNGNTTVFLNISLQTMENTPAIGRVLVGSLLNTVYMADGAVRGRVLFMLDEAARIGKLKVLETARDAGRKYGITLSLLYQSMGQIDDIWGRDGARAWIDSVSWIAYAAIKAAGAGQSLAEQLGTHAVMAYSEGDNRGSNSQAKLGRGSRSKGSNTSAHEIKRSLISAAEMQQDMRDDEVIIVPSSGQPIRCGRPIYFRRPELDNLVEQSRFFAKVAAD